MPCRICSLKPSLYHTSAPSASNAARTRAFTSALRRRKSSSVGLAPTLVKQVKGTPQARWRDSTQSGRASIMACRRLRPDGGVHVTRWLIEFSARLRIVSPFAPMPSSSGLSMATNHCGVLR